MADMPTFERYIGLQSERRRACDTVEAGAVRRYAQAIMDEDPLFGEGRMRGGEKFGPVAPLLYPTFMWRRALGETDPIAENAADPDFDGSSVNALFGLPRIREFDGYALLNGGAENEFLRHARPGEEIFIQSRYADIVHKQTSKGPIYLVTVETSFTGAGDDVVMRLRRTFIRRKA